MRNTNSGWGEPWAWAWAGVFAANLILPLCFGLIVTSRGGRVGMFAAAGLMFVAGMVVVPRWRAVRAPLVVGGVVTAVSQVYPLLQVLAALAAGAVLNFAWLSPDGPTEPVGFLLTLLTGGFLMGMAVGIGGLLYGVWNVLVRSGYGPGLVPGSTVEASAPAPEENDPRPHPPGA